MKRYLEFIKESVNTSEIPFVFFQQNMNNFRVFHWDNNNIIFLSKENVKINLENIDPNYIYGDHILFIYKVGDYNINIFNNYKEKKPDESIQKIIEIKKKDEYKMLSMLGDILSNNIKDHTIMDDEWVKVTQNGIKWETIPTDILEKIKSENPDYFTMVDWGFI